MPFLNIYGKKIPIDERNQGWSDFVPDKRDS